MTAADIDAAVGRYYARHPDGARGLKAALIDMDGTLYDSMPWHARAWHRMVTELGIEATVDEFFAYEGMTGRATVDLLFGRAFGRSATDDEVERLYGIKSEYFKAMNRATIMPGALEAVRTLRGAGVATVLVTGSGQASLLERLNDDFEGAFPAGRRITARDVRHGKPSPEPYLAALGLAHCAPTQAIVVENAPLGVEAGVAAGVFTVAVNTGPIPAQALSDAGADIVFDSMPDFARHLGQLIDSFSRYNGNT